jgi:hypothetical protein
VTEASEREIVAAEKKENRESERNGTERGYSRKPESERPKKFSMKMLLLQRRKERYR